MIALLKIQNKVILTATQKQLSGHEKFIFMQKIDPYAHVKVDPDLPGWPKDYDRKDLVVRIPYLPLVFHCQNFIPKDLYFYNW